MNTPRTDEAFEQFEKHRNVDRLKRGCRGIERDLNIVKESFLNVTHENDQLRNELQLARERIEVLLAALEAANHRVAELESWMADKIKTGWIWGEVKDPERKTHPCIKPYEQLPFRERVKDYVFRAVVKAMASTIITQAEPTPVQEGTEGTLP